MSHSIQLLKCPACGGPLDPPADAITYKCPYCSNTMNVPEKFRVQKKANPSYSVFGNLDTSSLTGYGAQWSDIVSLAQSGKREDAIKKYMDLTGNSESDATFTVDALKTTNTVDVNSYISNAYSAPINLNWYSKIMGWSLAYSGLSLVLGCGVTLVILIVVGVILFSIFGQVFGSF